VKTQDRSQLIDQRVISAEGRMIGRVVAPWYEPAPSSVVWMLVRLRGPGRRQFRAIPASDVLWQDYRGMIAPIAFEIVRSSPPATEELLQDPGWRELAARHYQLT
jgi:hypothetical protein